MESVLHKTKNTSSIEGLKHPRLLNVYSEFPLRVSICQTMRPRRPRRPMKPMKPESVYWLVLAGTGWHWLALSMFFAPSFTLSIQERYLCDSIQQSVSYYTCSLYRPLRSPCKKGSPCATLDKKDSPCATSHNEAFYTIHVLCIAPYPFHTRNDE
jgi:hypothetical protein